MEKRIPLVIRQVAYNLRGGFLVRPLIITFKCPRHVAGQPLGAGCKIRVESMLSCQASQTSLDMRKPG